MYMKIFKLPYLYFASLLILAGCGQKQQVDLVIKNATVYTMDSAMSKASVVVIDKGKIIATGGADLLQKYEGRQTEDYTGKFIYPGLNDAHAHFYGLGMYKQTVDLTGTKSWKEVLERCEVFVKANHPAYLTGRGWDQNDWEIKEFPLNDELNRLFPAIPVLLKRVDGHAAIANDAALKLAGLNLSSTIPGGQVIVQHKKLTGLLVDNAVDAVQDQFPKPDRKAIANSLLLAQQECLVFGLTSITDPGLETEVIEVIDSLHKAGTLKIRINAMISISDRNIAYWFSRKPYITERLNVSSFKMYADGALGSRGACLLQPYSDKHNHFGMLITSPEKMEAYVSQMANSPFQLNTHCIGDSANHYVMGLYAKYLGKNNGRRWRIEHAQIIHQEDFNLFGSYGIIPSAQPTHATSDMYWASERLGEERLKGSYALKLLLRQNGWLPLGTDFPVEYVSPFFTFYAAVARKDSSGFPPQGFQAEHGLTREEALRGMTIWAAKGSFEETSKGSLEAGKVADIVVLNEDLLSDDLLKIRKAKAVVVYIGGEKVIK